MIDYAKLDGLIPAVVQDHDSGEVLMVGFMNEEALAETRRSGFATFYSRTRQRLWTKGDTSGNRLAVERILVDCDADTILLKVKCLGDGHVCHTGARTCFFKDLSNEASPQPHESTPTGIREPSLLASGQNVAEPKPALSDKVDTVERYKDGS